MAGHSGGEDRNAESLDPRAVEEIIRVCLAPRDLESFCVSLGYGAAFGNRERARLLAEAFAEDATLRIRITRLLAASTRSFLEQVRLATEIELEQIALGLDSSRPAEFWGFIWAMAHDGRKQVRELALEEIDEYFRRLTPPPAPAVSPGEAVNLAAAGTQTSSAEKHPAFPALAMSSPPGLETVETVPALSAAPELNDVLNQLVQEVRLLGQRQMETDSRILAQSERLEKLASEPGSTGRGGDSLALRALTNLESLMDGLSARQREIKGLTVSELDALRTELRNLSSQEEEARRSLAALSARVVTLGNEIRDTRLKEILDRIDGNLNQLISANRRLEAAIGPRDETIRVMLDNLRSSQGELLQVAADIANRMEEPAAGPPPVTSGISTALERLLASVETLQAESRQSIETIHQRLESLSLEQARLQSGLETLASARQDSAAEPALETIQARLADQNKQINQLTSLLEGTAQKLSEIEAGKQELAQEVTRTLQQAVAREQPPEEMKRIEERVDSVTGLLNTLRHDQSEAQNMLKALAERLGREEDRVSPDSAILEKLSALHETVAELDRRILSDISAPPEPLLPPESVLSMEATPAMPPADDGEILRLREEVQRLQERCAVLERCLDESSRREMDELLEEGSEAEKPPTPVLEPEKELEHQPLISPEESSELEPDETTISDETEELEDLVWPAQEVPNPGEDKALAIPETESADYVHQETPEQNILQTEIGATKVNAPALDNIVESAPLPEAGDTEESEASAAPIYHNDLIILIGGKEDYENSYRKTATDLGARLERYATLDALDHHQISDVVARSDLLILIGEALTTSGGVRAQRIALDTNHRCFIHHSAQPKSLRRFLVNLVQTGQV